MQWISDNSTASDAVMGYPYGAVQRKLYDVKF